MAAPARRSRDDGDTALTVLSARIIPQRRARSGSPALDCVEETEPAHRRRRARQSGTCWTVLAPAARSRLPLRSRHRNALDDAASLFFHASGSRNDSAPASYACFHPRGARPSRRCSASMPCAFRPVLTGVTWFAGHNPRDARRAFARSRSRNCASAASHLDRSGRRFIAFGIGTSPAACDRAAHALRRPLGPPIFQPLLLASRAPTCGGLVSDAARRRAPCYVGLHCRRYESS